MSHKGAIFLLDNSSYNIYKIYCTVKMLYVVDNMAFIVK